MINVNISVFVDRVLAILIPPPPTFSALLPKPTTHWDPACPRDPPATPPPFYFYFNSRRPGKVLHAVHLRAHGRPGQVGGLAHGAQELAVHRVTRPGCQATGGAVHLPGQRLHPLVCVARCCPDARDGRGCGVRRGCGGGRGATTVDVVPEEGDTRWNGGGSDGGRWYCMVVCARACTLGGWGLRPILLIPISWPEPMLEL